MTTQQDEVQSIVGELSLCIVGRRPIGPDRKQRRLAPGDTLGPEPPDNVPICGGVQPTSRIVGTPSCGQRLAARTKASPKASSTRSIRRVRATSSDNNRPHSAR